MCDIRDKVFGLHSLAPDCCQREVAFTYAASNFDISGRIIKHHHYHHRAEPTLAIQKSHVLHQVLQASVKVYYYSEA
jgi:hypothetical protein